MANSYTESDNHVSQNAESDNHVSRWIRAEQMESISPYLILSKTRDSIVKEVFGEYTDFKDVSPKELADYYGQYRENDYEET